MWSRYTDFRSTGIIGTFTSGRRRSTRSVPWRAARRSGFPKPGRRLLAPKRCRFSDCENRRAAAAAGRARALVQPLRSAVDLDGDHPPPRSRGQRLLPALLHGTDPRGRQRQAGRLAVSRRAWESASGFTSKIHRLDCGGRVAAQAGGAPSAHRHQLGGLVSARTPKLGSTARWERWPNSTPP